MRTGILRAVFVWTTWCLASAAAFGQDRRNAPGRILDQQATVARYSQQNQRDSDELARLRSEVARLNRMAEHVRVRMQPNGANAGMWRDFSRIQSNISQLNYRMDHGDRDYSRIRREISEAGANLHRIEEQLHLRPNDYYR